MYQYEHLRETITITLIDGRTIEWSVNEYTEYDFEGRFFVVKEKDQWVGMYAIDHILMVEIR